MSSTFVRKFERRRDCLVHWFYSSLVEKIEQAEVRQMFEVKNGAPKSTSMELKPQEIILDSSKNVSNPKAAL